MPAYVVEHLQKLVESHPRFTRSREEPLSAQEIEEWAHRRGIDFSFSDLGFALTALAWEEKIAIYINRNGEVRFGRPIVGNL